MTRPSSSGPPSRKSCSTLLITFCLVVGVTYLFLQDWRATLIPTLTIPVSLIGTFAVLLALGFSANTVTLFALILAIGLVVDDAIVVVENVQRIMEEEKLGPKAGRDQGHEPGDRTDHRHHPGPAGRFRAGGISSRASPASSISSSP